MIEVYIDGASSGNPGPSGAGIFIKGNGKVEEYAIPLGTMDNHEAEFTALVKALEICREKQFRIVSVRTDSKIVSDSMEKQFVKRRELKPYLKSALAITGGFDLFFIKWIPGRQNKQADRLAKEAIRKNKE